MTNLHNYIVSTSEAEALKEMIFKRARERAESFNHEVNDNYTTSMQNDVMDLARNSFVANKNPFSQIKELEKKEEISQEDEIGFAQRRNEIKTQINSTAKESQATISLINKKNKSFEALA